MERVVVAISPTKPQRCCIDCAKKIDTQKLDAAGMDDENQDEESKLHAFTANILKRIPTSRATIEGSSHALSSPENKVLSILAGFGSKKSMTDTDVDNSRPVSIKILQQQMDSQQQSFAGRNKKSRPISNRKFDELMLEIPHIESIEEEKDSDDEYDNNEHGSRPSFEVMVEDTNYIHTPLFVEDSDGTVLRKRSNSVVGKGEVNVNHLSGRYVPIKLPPKPPKPGAQSKVNHEVKSGTVNVGSLVDKFEQNISIKPAVLARSTSQRGGATKNET